MRAGSAQYPMQIAIVRCIGLGIVERRQTIRVRCIHVGARSDQREEMHGAIHQVGLAQSAPEERLPSYMPCGASAKANTAAAQGAAAMAFLPLIDRLKLAAAPLLQGMSTSDEPVGMPRRMRT